MKVPREVATNDFCYSSQMLFLKTWFMVRPNYDQYMRNIFNLGSASQRHNIPPSAQVAGS